VVGSYLGNEGKRSPTTEKSFWEQGKAGDLRVMRRRAGSEFGYGSVPVQYDDEHPDSGSDNERIGGFYVGLNRKTKKGGTVKRGEDTPDASELNDPK